MFYDMHERKYLTYSAAVQDRSLLLRYTAVSTWENKRNLLYWISYFNKNEYIVSPKWSITDLASSPCFAQCLIPKEKYLISRIHDEGYSKKDTYVYIIDRNALSLKFKDLEKHWEWMNDNTFIPNRKFWDILFLEWMEEERLVFYDESWTIAPCLAYLAVRLFGWLKYKKK